jgi:hypothetical protein
MPSEYKVPSDEHLLKVYAQGTDGAGDGSSYDGWAALWMDGYRDGALVRPNVESNASNVGQAWGEYYRPGMSSEEAQAFKAGYAYGKRADGRVGTRSPWFWPLAAFVTLVILVGIPVVAAVIFP